MGSTSKTIILSKPADWEPWFFTIRSLAEGGKVWELIDPDLTTEPAVPAELEVPTAIQVNQNKNSIVELDPDARELYKLLLVQPRNTQQRPLRSSRHLDWPDRTVGLGLDQTRLDCLISSPVPK